MMRKHIIVIGSGFGGLGAAIRLAARGYDVEIFEKRDKPGGRGYQYEVNGFKFDGGPTVMTAPYMFDELFEGTGKKRDDYFTLVPLNPFYRIFDHQGNYFNYYHQLEDFLDEIARISPKDVNGYRKFDRHTRKIFEIFHPFTDKSFYKLDDMMKIVPDVMRLQAFTSAYLFAARYVRDPFLRRVFSFHPLLVGGNPFDTPAIFTLIVQFEREWGVHYAMGGTGAVVRGLERLYKELGGKIHYNTEVKEIIIQNNRAAGVRLQDGSDHYADRVVCNGDVAFAYRHLIPENFRKKFTNTHIDHMRYSMSLFVWYFGTKKRYLDSPLHHHNIILSENYRKLLSNIFYKNVLSDEFSLYLHMPSITDATIAPEGCESFYVLSPVPTLDSGTDWEVMEPIYRGKIAQFLEDNYLPDLQANLIAEHAITPLHFQNTLNSYKGAAFSVKPSLLQSGWFRPHNKSEEFEDLYFVGAGTHPGAGVPAVLSSGKIAAQDILADDQ
jgi:phytoene desaturase